MFGDLVELLVCINVRFAFFYLLFKFELLKNVIVFAVVCYSNLCVYRLLQYIFSRFQRLHVLLIFSLMTNFKKVLEIKIDL